MGRVVRSGGIVAAYAWDMAGGGFPYETLLAEMRGLGITAPAPPSPDASRIDMMRDLWAGAALVKRGRSLCTAHSPTSTTSGRRCSEPRASG